MQQLDSYVAEHQQRFEQELIDWLKIPSISTDSEYAADVREAAQWLIKRLDNIGLKTEIIETSGHPIVFAESKPVENAPTVLVYGHYDVQPPDPLDEWTTPPFEPRVDDRKVYARGATDDKGQVITHVYSVEAWMKQVGDLPVQIKFLIEGEEESGSGGLYDFLGRYEDDPRVREKMAADIAVISDTSQYGPEMPAITYGLRGLAYFELRLQGPNRDLHSGAFGGTVANPGNVLNDMLSAIMDPQGRIQIPGFYDNVLPLTEREKGQFDELKFDEEAYKQQLGVAELSGEQGHSTLERRWSRPTFDINGLTSGYQGEGAKTVLPARASAKFSFRLVPNQDPRKVASELEKMLQAICPQGITMELVDMHGAEGFVLPLDSPFMQAASIAVEHGFGKKPVFIRSGGSIPVVNSLKKMLGIDTLLLGWGQDDDNPHSPDEKFSLDDFARGIRASCKLWEELGKISL